MERSVRGKYSGQGEGSHFEVGDLKQMQVRFD